MDRACFERRDSQGWNKNGCGGLVNIGQAPVGLSSDGPANSGKNAMKITFSKNEDFGGAVAKVSGDWIFTRFYEYYAPGFDFGNGMKIHRLLSANKETGMNNYDIIVYSSPKNNTNPQGELCGVNELDRINIAKNAGAWWTDYRSTQVRGRWYAFETEVKLNTPGRSDGEMRVYLDGALVIEKTGLNIREGSSAPITDILFGGWYSNGAAGRNLCPDPVTASIRYIDDIVVADAYIGPEPEVIAAGEGQVDIAFTTPRPGTTVVEYGETAALGRLTPVDRALVTSHRARLSGLAAGKTYYYRVSSDWNNGYRYVSPLYAFDPSLARAPVRPRPGPRNLPPPNYDPIPD